MTPARLRLPPRSGFWLVVGIGIAGLIAFFFPFLAGDSAPTGPGVVQMVGLFSAFWSAYLLLATTAEGTAFTPLAPVALMNTVRIHTDRRHHPRFMLASFWFLCTVAIGCLGVVAFGLHTAWISVALGGYVLLALLLSIGQTRTGWMARLSAIYHAPSSLWVPQIEATTLAHALLGRFVIAYPALLDPAHHQAWLQGPSYDAMGAKMRILTGEAQTPWNISLRIDPHGHLMGVGFEHLPLLADADDTVGLEAAERSIRTFLARMPPVRVVIASSSTDPRGTPVPYRHDVAYHLEDGGAHAHVSAHARIAALARFQAWSAQLDTWATGQPLTVDS